MTRIGIALLTLMICSPAHAQPAPRVTLDVALPVADGFTVDRYWQRGRMAVGSDGMHYILMHQVVAGREPLDPVREARIDLLAVAPDGTVKLRKPLPVPEKLGLAGFAISSLGITAARSGDLAVFWSPNDAGHDSRPGRSFGTLLRLGADGSVKKATPIGAPSMKHARQDPGAYYELYVHQPTPDNAVLLGGGFGSGPYAWWMGKFSLDGVRLWQAGPGNGFPEHVTAIGQRWNASWLSLVTEMNPKGGLDWFIRHNAANGSLLSRRPAPLDIGNAAAVLGVGVAFISYVDARAEATELVLADDTGRVRRRVPWPFSHASVLLADGNGLAAIVEVSTGPNSTQGHVVRVDAQGTLLWRGAAADIAEIARTPDGQIAALVRTGKDGESLRLVRYADP